MTKTLKSQVFLLCLLVGGLSQAASKSRSLYPRYVEVSGIVEELKTNGLVRVEKKSLIVDGLHLIVKPGASVKIELDDKRALRAYGETEFEIPNLSWETRKFAEIRLKRGALRFEVQGQPFPFLVKSPLFEISPPIGEYVLRVDPDKAQAEALVLEGELDFRALNSEESALVKSNQKVSFWGLLEEGEISYDLLLQGKKIPKGRLGPVEALSGQDQKLYSQVSEKKALEKKKKVEQEARKKELAILGESLCHKPRGQLNQCYWKKQGGLCHRTRCAADGQWKDPHTVEPSECGGESVRPCNY